MTTLGYFPYYEEISTSHLSAKTKAWLAEKSGDGPLDLSDVTDTCETFHIRARLCDETGRLLGRVREDGAYELASTYDRIAAEWICGFVGEGIQENENDIDLIEIARLTGQGWAECLFLAYPSMREKDFSKIGRLTEAWSLAPGSSSEEKAEYLSVVYTTAENRWCILQREYQLAEMRRGVEP